jgi:hypothetical protein
VIAPCILPTYPVNIVDRIQGASEHWRTGGRRRPRDAVAQAARPAGQRAGLMRGGWRCQPVLDGDDSDRRPPRRRPDRAGHEVSSADQRPGDHQDAEDRVDRFAPLIGPVDVFQAPLPDRISLVTILLMIKVTSIARNIHIMGRSERSPRPTGILSPGETFTLDGIFTRGGIRTREASQHPVLTASTCIPVITSVRLRHGPMSSAPDLQARRLPKGIRWALQGKHRGMEPNRTMRAARPL